MAGAY
jgi:hypothetical protein